MSVNVVLEYTASVFVTVDTARKEVLSVKVFDEDVAGPKGRDKATLAAAEIAAAAEWPAWEFGA
jgi:hypothetical protein